MKKCSLAVFLLLLGLFLGGCQTENAALTAVSVENTVAEEAVLEIEYVNGRFTPPPGKTLLIIGQDIENIDAYTASVQPNPGGTTAYTSLKGLEGINSVAQNPGGLQHMDYLAETYPNSTIAVGLYLVNTLEGIYNGRADNKIDKLLDDLAEYGSPVYLRFGYEFDGSWNAYKPDEYVSAWIYFRERMLERDIDNVALVWQGATYCDGTFLDEPIEAWYPGDEYVDWVGLSYFVQADCEFEPLQEMVDFARSHQKPLMIAESTPQRYDLQNLTYSVDGRSYQKRTAEQIWDEWYAPYFDFIKSNADVVRAVAYINARWDDQPMWGPPYGSGYWGDSRVQANALIQARWVAETGQSNWLSGDVDIFELLGYQK